MAAQVHAVDLKRLARATGCTEIELVRAIHGVDSSFAAAAALAAPAQQIAFTEERQAPRPGQDDWAGDSLGQDEAATTTALISLAARPGILDHHLPKCLTPIGTQPLIGHVLDQLHAGGIRHVILVVGAHGARLRRAIESLPIARRMALQFIDLGPGYMKGFARSLLAASPLLGQPSDDFLLCTPDHIFDASLISEMRTSACRAGIDAVALVEANVRSVNGALPPTAVHVRLADAPPSHPAGRAWPDRSITHIGTKLAGASAIEAGLYRCSGALFAVISELSASRTYFTVAEAMQGLASSGRLGAMMTNGRRWLALETVDQMESTLNTTVGRDGRAHFPWQLHKVRADPLSPAAQGAAHTNRRVHEVGVDVSEPGDDDASSQRLVLPLTPDPHAAAFRPTSSYPSLDFLLVPSTEAQASAATGALSEPLLDHAAPTPTAASEMAEIVDARAVNAAVGAVSSGLSALSIEVSRPLNAPVDDGAMPAYIIELPPSPVSVATALPSLLALPAPRGDLEPPLSLCDTPLPLLPPAIDSVTLSSSDEAIQLTVHKSVPSTGWLLLATALLTCYSSAPVTDLQGAWLPSHGEHVFVRSAWRGIASSLVCALFACAYPTSREHLYAVVCLRLERSTALALLGAGLAFFVNFGAFNLALEHTSIAHASLFESCSSIYMVVGQLTATAVGRARGVPTAQVLGAVLGGVGAWLTTRDAPAAADDDASVATQVSMMGDLTAMCSGLGAAVYLSVAERIRVDLDPLAFFSLLMAQFALLCVGASFMIDETPPSFSEPWDEQSGILGWLNLVPGRFGVQLWLALIVDLAGNLGFVAVMKFVPALTVAAVMLLGPFVATVEGIAVGVDQMPGAWTLAGALLITLGSGLICIAARESTATVEIHRTRAGPEQQ